MYYANYLAAPSADVQTFCSVLYCVYGVVLCVVFSMGYVWLMGWVGLLGDEREDIGRKTVFEGNSGNQQQDTKGYYEAKAGGGRLYNEREWYVMRQ